MRERVMPWSEFGTDITKSKSVKDALRDAKLDWKVKVEPMQIVSNGKPVTIANCLMKSNDGMQLDVVGKSYVPTQNVEAFQIFDDYVSAGEAQLHTIGQLRMGRVVWGLASLNEKFDLGQDPVEAHVLLVCPHIQGKALMAALTPIRFLCANTIRLALRKAIGRFRMVHRQEFNKAMQEKAKREIGLMRDEFKVFGNQARTMKKKRMGEKEALAFFNVLTGAEKNDDPSRVVSAMIDAFKNAPGADPKSAWGAFNAVTYYADHVASRTPDKRMSNAWLGKTGVIKTRALELLI